MVQQRSDRTGGGRIRVGAVTYLNARPLVFSLARFAPQVEIVIDLPSRLADSLAAGQLDVAMIPSIEFARGSGYAIISDACIACDGAVRSVKLYSRVPIERLRTLALDEGSRTSAALVRILLKERFGVWPETPAAADRRRARRCAGRRGDVDRRPGHVADQRPFRVRVGPGRGVVAVDGPAVCLRRVDRPAGGRSVGHWRGVGRRPRRRHHPAGRDCPASGPRHRSPRGRLPFVPPRPSDVSLGAAAAAGVGTLLRAGRAA